MTTRLAKKKRRSVAAHSRNDSAGASTGSPQQRGQTQLLGKAVSPCRMESVNLPNSDPREFRRSTQTLQPLASAPADPQPLPATFPMPMLTPPEAQGERLIQNQVPDYQPFPVDCFPQPVRDCVAAHARVLNCDPAAVALPVLSVLASAVGDRRIRIKQAWTEPANLWTALIAEEQTCHTAALKAAIAPLVVRESQAFAQQQQLMPDYERSLTRYRAEVRLARKDQGPEPDRPAVPPVARSIAADWTLPSVVRLLSKQRRGLLVCAHEMDGWLGRALGSGSRASLERQAWFDLHDGRSVTVESRSDRPSLHLGPVPVSVTGSLSEELLTEKLAKVSGPSGLASRLLFASPPTHALRWTDDDVEQTVTDGYAAVVDLLFADASTRSEGLAGEVQLAPAAKDCLAAFSRDLSDAQRGMDDLLFTWSSNLAGQAARLALVLHLTRWAAGDVDDATVCDLASMQRGIALARWFAYEAQRVVTRLSLELDLLDDLRLVDWLRRRGGKATPRDLCRSNRRKYPTLEAATNAFSRLVGTGLTDWTARNSGPNGGRPTRELVLPQSTDDLGGGKILDDRKPLSQPGGTGIELDELDGSLSGAGLADSARGPGEVSSGAIVSRGDTALDSRLRGNDAGIAMRPQGASR